MAAEAKKLLVRANRRNLSSPVIKKLFALSGNKCAKCRTRLVYTEIHAVKGIICHIEAASELGPRYNVQQTEEDRYDYANLIILCPNCHADIDKNPQKYSVEYLRSLKQQHEAKYEKEQYHPDDEIIHIMKVSINQDEFSLNNILRLFEIYFKLKDPSGKKFFIDNRLNYSLKNLSLETLENDSATMAELDEVFMHMNKLSDNEFAHCFITLQSLAQQNKLPSQIFKDYLDSSKDRLKNILLKNDKLVSGMFWLVYEPNEDSLNKLIDSAGNYNAETFKDLLIQFNFGQFDNEKKLTIEEKLWNILDGEEDNNSNKYKNLLELDTRLFNSLQAKQILD
jgi:5-methylcytosine-specific restriction endonuclease McrA